MQLGHELKSMIPNGKGQLYIARTFLAGKPANTTKWRFKAPNKWLENFRLS